MSVSAIPEGFHAITAYLCIDGASEAIRFYKKAFDAVEGLRLNGPGGSVMHAELKIGNSMLMLADEFPDMGFVSPTKLSGSPINLCLYVDDCDAMFAQAIAAGAEQLKPVEDQFYGDRSGTLKDPFGHSWTVATHIEDLTEQEVQQRLNAMMQQG